jgi:hypothetical protein
VGGKSVADPREPKHLFCDRVVPFGFAQGRLFGTQFLSSQAFPRTHVRG